MIPADMQKHFRMAVRLMLFLFKFSCPDISNSVRELAKVNDGATKNQADVESCEVCVDTCSKALKFKLKSNKKNDKVWNIYRYCDTYFAGDKDTRFNVSGFWVL